MRRSANWFLVFVLALTGNAWAQGSEALDWKITPYLWAVGINGDATLAGYDQELDVSFSDILSDFNGGGSVYLEIGKGHHAFALDYTYISLKPDDTPLPSPPTP